MQYVLSQARLLNRYEGKSYVDAKGPCLSLKYYKINQRGFLTALNARLLRYLHFLIHIYAKSKANMKNTFYYVVVLFYNTYLQITR